MHLLQGRALQQGWLLGCTQILLLDSTILVKFVLCVKHSPPFPFHMWTPSPNLCFTKVSVHHVVFT